MKIGYGARRGAELSDFAALVARAIPLLRKGAEEMLRSRKHHGAERNGL